MPRSGNRALDSQNRRSFLTAEIVPTQTLVRAGLDACRPIIRAQGERARRRFTNSSPRTSVNRNARAAYARTAKQFFEWTDKRRLELHEIEAITVAAYIEQLGTTVSKPTVKQHLAPIRRLFDYLTKMEGFSTPTWRARCEGPNMW
jgi:hypothetical protein